MIRPIPKKQLPHTATYEAYTGNSGETDTYSTSVSITNVKFEPKKTVRHTNNGFEVIGDTLMFYDYVNSSGITGEPVKRSKITFGGREYEIQDVEVLYANSLHHYEVILI